MQQKGDPVDNQAAHQPQLKVSTRPGRQLKRQLRNGNQKRYPPNKSGVQGGWGAHGGPRRQRSWNPLGAGSQERAGQGEPLHKVAFIPLP